MISEKEEQVIRSLISNRANPERVQEIINALTDEEVQNIDLYFSLMHVPKSKRWIITIGVNFLYELSKIETFLHEKYSRLVRRLYVFRARLAVRFENKKDGLS